MRTDGLVVVGVERLGATTSRGERLGATTTDPHPAEGWGRGWVARSV